MSYYTAGEVMAARERLHHFIWTGTDINDPDLIGEVVDKLLAKDYVSDVLFQEIKEEK